MKVTIFRSGRRQYAIPWLEAIEEGFKKHNIKPEWATYNKSNIDCDLAVFWSHKHHHIIKRQLEAGHDYLVMERGYIGNRKHWMSLGFNGLNGKANFHVNNMPSDRWNKHFSKYLKPWKKDGKYLLLIGQMPYDETVRNIDYYDFLYNTYENMKRTGVPIRFRPHPKAKGRIKNYMYRAFPDIKISNCSLKEDLKDAYQVVMYNSNTGVDSILYGKPVVTFDKHSMVYNLSTHSIDEKPIYPERKQWAYNIAYCQWSLDEIKNGKAWEHLKIRYE